MRTFLPIKGPGGRYLTPREKVALLILGITLALCVLTVLAGDRAYAPDQGLNPISSFAAWLAQTFGGGIIALYALVLVWSGLIYFKGENVVRVGPLPGRLFAAMCVTIGISGLLGIPGLVTAGALGTTVGGAIGNTFGATLGFPILILLLMLGAHLAGQGAWSAMRGPAMAAAGIPGVSLGGGAGFGIEAATGRFHTDTPLPDDGDPTADERTLAVIQAVEEIERSQGVTIVDVDRPSIGEEVEAAPEPAEDTEEAEVQRGLQQVADVLAGPPPAPPMDNECTDDECIDVEEYRDREEPEDTADANGEACDGEDGDGETEAAEAIEAALAHADIALAKVESGTEAPDTDEPATDYDEETYDHDDDETDEFEPPASEASGSEASGSEIPDEADAIDDAEDAEEEDEDEEIEAESDEEDAEEDAENPEEWVEVEEDSDEDVDSDEVDDVDEDRPAAAPEVAENDPATDSTQSDDPARDPYARGGLLAHLSADPTAIDGEDAQYTAFDWRGRPLE